MSLERLPTIKDDGLYQRGTAAPFLQFGVEPQPVEKTPAIPQEDEIQPVMNAEQQRMQELDRMLQEAQSRADMVEREAYDKAYTAGEKSGMALGEKRADQTLEQMTQMLSQAEMQLASLDYMCREAILDISEAVVTQLLGDMGEQQYALLMKAVERAAFQFPDISGLILLVHPNDVQSFETLLPETSLSESRIRAQQDVEEGSCRLMSNQQDVLVYPNQALRESFDLLRQQFSA
ncbi:MAG: hypothetical protein COA61_006050 [Zetaproteobacteria bacterium]|nr:hypothetical protein [Zetaproteobacteria bacterium]